MRHAMLAHCRATVCDIGPTLNQHRRMVLSGIQTQSTRYTWANVGSRLGHCCDTGRALSQHRIAISCLLGRCQSTTMGKTVTEYLLTSSYYGLHLHSTSVLICEGIHAKSSNCLLRKQTVTALYLWMAVLCFGKADSSSCSLKKWLVTAINLQCFSVVLPHELATILI